MTMMREVNKAKSKVIAAVNQVLLREVKLSWVDSKGKFLE